jgi:hypothetical protein
VLKQQDFFGNSFHKPVHDILIRQEVGTFDRIPGVKVEAVAFILAKHRRRASFCANGMGTLDLHFRYEAHVDGVPGLSGDFHGRTKTGKARTKNQHIMGDHFNFLGTVT